MIKRSIVLVLLVLIGLVGITHLGASGSQESSEQQQSPETEKAQRIKLATTTSTENSGLLAYLLPEFRADTAYQVDVIAVGTGAALKLGESGDVDVVLVHARDKEDKFARGGYGVHRKDVMHNDFIILGPKKDPAEVGASETAAEALGKIAAAEANFVSRGDNSGTHFKEQSLWQRAGIEPAGQWYKEAGQGMGAVITISNDMGGYTLADRGSFIAMQDTLKTQILFEGDPLLYNPYGIISVNPELHDHINYEGAMALVNWMVGKKAQQLIGDFKKAGEQLFYPDALPDAE
ncbi:MAG: substrate-binding domain-containing protein [Spirochaetia bacterium]|nr:substrate-binding domain-containing protein [Spirochaetia bacterium]